MRLRSSEGGGSARPRPGQPDLAGDGRMPIGRILIEMRAISHDQLEAILARQAATGRLFGETAVDMGLADEQQVQRAIERQQSFHVLSAGDERVDPLVIAAFDPDDDLSRIVRDLRGTITGARREDGTPPRSVVIVGIDATTEAVVVTANLAVACAQAGYRTLLVDANLENPAQHGLFRLPNRAGVSTMLSASGDQRDIVQTSAVPNLSLLTAGPAVPNASELFDRERLFRKLRPFSDTFDLLLVDASDARGTGLAACEGADAALMAARKDGSSLRLFENAVEHLQSRGTMVLGSILTS